MSTNSFSLKRGVKKIGFLFVVSLSVGATVILAQFAIVLIFQAAKELGVDVTSFGSAITSLIVALLTYGLTLAFIALFQRFRNKPLTRKLLGLKQLLTWKDIGLGLVAVIPYWILTFLLVSLVLKLFQGFDQAQSQDVGFNHLQQGYQYLLAFITLVVLAPLAEETLFRGFLFGKLRVHAAFLPAAIFTSLTFGTLHGQWNVGIDTFALSLILCFLREKTGSIWAGVILHMLKNGISFYFLFVVPSIPGTM